jgi:uncharacterized protein involved in exopolysaccharide biosynthesis
VSDYGGNRDGGDAAQGPVSTGPSPALPESVDLIAFGAVTWRNKWVFSGVFLVTFGIFVTIGFLRPESYRFTAVMQVGTTTAVSGGNSVPSTHTVVTQLQQVYVPQVIGRAASRDARLGELTIEVSAGAANDNTVTLSTMAPRSETNTVRTLLGEMVHAATKGANEKLDAYSAGERRYLNQQLTAVQDQIAQLEKQAGQLDNSDGGGAAAASYLAVQVAQLVQLAGHYREQLVLLPANVEHAGLVGEPVRSVLPVGYRRVVWILLGILAGLVFGGAAVIAVRFVAGVRRRLSHQAA